MILLSILFSFFQNNTDVLSAALFESGQKAFEMVVPLVCLNAFFNGLLNIALHCGILDKMAKLFYPLMSRIFPDLKHHKEALAYISGNLAINLFGLSNAATPFGMKAMQEMQKENQSNEASRSMTTFLILNTAGITLCSTTLLSMRITYGSNTPAFFLPYAFMTSLSACIIALMIDRWCNYR
jgi:spore maturation protein A